MKIFLLLAVVISITGSAWAKDIVVVKSSGFERPAGVVGCAWLGEYMVLEIDGEEIESRLLPIIAILRDKSLSSIVWVQNRDREQPPQSLQEKVVVLDNGWLIERESALADELPRDGLRLVCNLYDGFRLIEDRQHRDVTGRQELSDLVAEVSETELTARINELVDFETRYSRSTGFRDSTLYLESELISYGLATELQPFTISGGLTVENVIATLPGEVDPDTHIIICAHYDSTSNDPYNHAPGADDNASGAAGVLEAARICSGYRFGKTIKFVLFAAEELGLLGSAYYVQQAQAQGEVIPDVVNLDMIGYGPLPSGYVVLLESSSIGIPLMDILEEQAYSFTGLGVTRSLNPFGSDHVPFLNAGIPAVLVIENEWDSNPNYHRTTDLPGYLNYQFVTDIMRMNVAAVAELAGLLSPIETPSPSPTASPTPTESPQATPTPEPTFIYANPDIRILMNDTIYTSFEQVQVETTTTNYSSAILTVNHYAVLEAYGIYYFHPAWILAPDFTTMILQPFSEETRTILDFQLPQLFNTQGPFYFWALLTAPDDLILLCPAARARFILRP